MVPPQQIAETQTELLRRVRVGIGLSRVTLARAMGLSPTTVGSHVERLMRAGYLREGSPSARGDRGRPATRLELNPRAGFLLGLDFTHRYVRAVALDFTERVLAEERMEVAADAAFAEVLERVLALAERCAAGASGPLIGIGLSVPGLTATETRYFREWDAARVAAGFEGRFGQKPEVATSGHAGAASELWFGCGRQTGAFVSLECRATVAAGLVIGGRLLADERPGTGQIGHWRCPSRLLPARVAAVDPESVSLDELASVQGMLRNCRRLAAGADGAGEEILFSHLYRGYEEGDEVARQVVDAAAVALGWCLARLNDLAAPELAIVRFPHSLFGKRFIDGIQAAVAEQNVTGAASVPRVVASTESEYAGAVGAAAIALHHWQVPIEEPCR